MEHEVELYVLHELPEHKTSDEPTEVAQQFENELVDKPTKEAEHRKEVAEEATEQAELRNEIVEESTEEGAQKNEIGEETTEAAKLKKLEETTEEAEKKLEETTEVDEIKSELVDDPTEDTELKNELAKDWTEEAEIKSELAKKRTEEDKLKTEPVEESNEEEEEVELKSEIFEEVTEEKASHINDELLDEVHDNVAELPENKPYVEPAFDVAEQLANDLIGGMRENLNQLLVLADGYPEQRFIMKLHEVESHFNRIYAQSYYNLENCRLSTEATLTFIKNCNIKFYQQFGSLCRQQNVQSLIRCMYMLRKTRRDMLSLIKKIERTVRRCKFQLQSLRRFSQSVSLQDRYCESGVEICRALRINLEEVENATFRMNAASILIRHYERKIEGVLE